MSYVTAAVDSTTLRFGATHPWGATPGVAAEARSDRARSVPAVAPGRGAGPLRVRHEARAPVQRRLLFDRRGPVGGAQRRARRAGPRACPWRRHAVRRPVVRRRAALAAQDAFLTARPARGDELIRLVPVSFGGVSSYSRLICTQIVSAAGGLGGRRTAARVLVKWWDALRVADRLALRAGNAPAAALGRRRPPRPRPHRGANC